MNYLNWAQQKDVITFMINAKAGSLDQ